MIGRGEVQELIGVEGDRVSCRSFLGLLGGQNQTSSVDLRYTRENRVFIADIHMHRVYLFTLRLLCICRSSTKSEMIDPVVDKSGSWIGCFFVF